MYLLDDAGALVDSEFSFDVDSGFTSIVIESSGGANPSAGIERRNPDYNNLFNILLQRLSRMGTSITGVVLDSQTFAKFPASERTAVLKREYPFTLENLDLDELRREIGRAVARMHRSPGAKSGGNAQRRIRVCTDRIINPDELLASSATSDAGDRLQEHSPGHNETEREYIRKARVGQGKFREDLVQRFHSSCPVTGIEHPDLLVASHIKPWKACTNAERLDPNNGILLSSLIDRLFDKGLVTFDEDGNIAVSPELCREDLRRCNLESARKITLSKQAEHYLTYHRMIEFHR